MKTHQFGKHALFATVIVAGLASVPIDHAAPVSYSPASLVPLQVLSARKVFLSNAGLDSNSIVALSTLAKTQSDIPYAGFVAAMSHGRYDSVVTPADSDVVFEFRVESAFHSLNGPFPSAFLGLTLLDPKTHFVLWTVKTPLDVNKKFDQNVGVAVTTMLDSIESLGTTGSDAAK